MSSFQAKYFQRLGMDPATLNSFQPTYESLCNIQEAHLSNIPFENASQHGVDGTGCGLASLDLDRTETKILDKLRGGFCLELNLLLAKLLRSLGYHVNIVRAIVNASGAFRQYPTHIILIVKCPTYSDDDNDEEQQHFRFVDVGFGEPPIHPLRYVDTHNNREQVTPEGMESKIVLEDNGLVVLYWLSDGVWKPRLKWDYHESIQRAEQQQDVDEDIQRLKLQGMLDAVHQPDSIFSKKLVVCRLTRNEKQTIAGDRYKVTGPPRFSHPLPDTTPTDLRNNNESNDKKKVVLPMSPLPPVSIRQLKSSLEVRHVMRDVYHIPMDSTDGLDLTKSMAAEPEIWSHQ